MINFQKWLTLGLILCSSACSSPPTLPMPQTSTIPIKEWKAPYPLNEKDVLRMLQQVLQTPVQDLTKAHVESIFNATLISNNEYPPESPWFFGSTKPPLGWYFKLIFEIRPDRSGLTFKWWDAFKQPDPYYVPLCVDVNALVQAAIKEGWVQKLQPYPSPHGINRRLYFNRSDGTLHIDRDDDFISRCLVGIDITYRKNK